MCGHLIGRIMLVPEWNVTNLACCVAEHSLQSVPWKENTIYSLKGPRIYYVGKPI